MAFRQIRVSDVSGKELDDAELVTVLVRLDGESKVVDVAAEEIANLKTVNGLVELEIKPANGPERTVFVTKTELGKVIPDEVLKRADSARGRRKNFSPAVNGSNGG